jgi:hypothetical protein
VSTVKATSYYDKDGTSNAVLYGVAAPTGSMGFRNRIINGDMRIDQRNAGAEVNPAASGAYYLDRWQVASGAASKFKIGRNAGSVTPPAGFVNYLGCTSLSAYSVGASEVFQVRQTIEANNVSDLGWGAAGAQSVTISFWVYSSLTGTFGGAIRNASSYNYSYPFSYTISAANTWEQKTITIAGPTAGTWGTGTSAGLELGFSLGAGSTLSGTAGSWSANNYTSATGATSVVGTNGATFYITGVQLEAGSVASPFERRDYGRELMMCQRYFETGRSWAGGRTTDGTAMMTANFKQTKRAAPTMAYTVVLGGVATGYAAYTDMAQVYNAAGTNSHGEVTWTASIEL